MEATEIVEKIKTVLKDVGGLGDAGTAISEADDLYEAGLTSRASVNVMLALEDEFDIEFPDQMLNRHTFQSIAAIRDAVAVILEG